MAAVLAAKLAEHPEVLGTAASVATGNLKRIGALAIIVVATLVLVAAVAVSIFGDGKEYSIPAAVLAGLSVLGGGYIFASAGKIFDPAVARAAAQLI